MQKANTTAFIFTFVRGDVKGGREICFGKGEKE
jgi:hypothetical protein